MFNGWYEKGISVANRDLMQKINIVKILGENSNVKIIYVHSIEAEVFGKKFSPSKRNLLRNNLYQNIFPQKKNPLWFEDIYKKNPLWF